MTVQEGRSRRGGGLQVSSIVVEPYNNNITGIIIQHRDGKRRRQLAYARDNNDVRMPLLLLLITIIVIISFIKTYLL